MSETLTILNEIFMCKATNESIIYNSCHGPPNNSFPIFSVNNYETYFLRKTCIFDSIGRYYEAVDGSVLYEFCQCPRWHWFQTYGIYKR